MITVALLTDFGEKSPFVGIMKGVVLRTAGENVNFIDLTHNISPFNIKEAMFWIGSMWRYFPKKTIFICVVDPGVGTKRKGIIVKKDEYFFIGPDNGIFSLLYNGKYEVYRITYTPRNISNTFHGRDIFAPVAGFIIRKENISKFSNKTTNFKKIIFPFAKKKGDKIHGEVLFSDHFGNLITNIKNKMIDGKYFLQSEKIKIKGPSKTYYSKRKGEFLFYKGSFGFIEIAVREGNAEKIFGQNKKIILTKIASQRF